VKLLAPPVILLGYLRIPIENFYQKSKNSQLDFFQKNHAEKIEILNFQKIYANIEHFPE